MGDARAPRLRNLPAAAVFAALLAGASESAAKPPELRLEASSLLGTSAPQGGAWLSVLVRVENLSRAPIRGTVEVETSVPWVARGADALSTRLPFALAPGASSRLEAPTRGFGGGESTIRVRAFDNEGRLLGETGLAPERPSDALLLHLSTPSRLAPVLRGLSFASRRTPPYGGHPRSCAIGVSSPPVDPATGDPLLPARASGYAEATVVLGSAQALGRLGETERAALAAWVLSGGALAVSLTRPEDLGDPTLRAVLGGDIARADPPDELFGSALFVLPAEDSDANPAAPLRTLALTPEAATRDKLTGYRGANLRATDWGASASYGLGEVHLLAFDADDAALITDPWTRHKVADLVRHSFDREPLAVLRQSGSGPETLVVDGVSRELDPNQATRWTIGVSALVLLIYAVLAGPVGFYLAARKGRPLRALFQLPLWSALTFGVVVLLGIIGKGVSGRARRLTLVDAGAGMTSGAAVFFRGFYAASSSELVVRAARREHVLDVAGLPDSLPRTLMVDRDGPRLTGLRTRPWETLLVREEGFFDLSGGISLVPNDGDLVVRNRAARDLIGVIVKPASGDARYFPRIRDGESVLVSKGRALASVGVPLSPLGPAVPLGVDAFASALEADYPGLAKVWRALEPAVSTSAEWWPPDSPMLIGALEGGRGTLSDSGLRVDYDRLLVRVVGNGGVP